VDSQGRVIRGQRKGRGSIFTSQTKHRKGACGLRGVDFAERNGYVRGVVKEIIHDPGRGAPVAKVQFANRYKFKKDNVQWTATEGTYTGQFIYCGKRGELSPPGRGVSLLGNTCSGASCAYARKPAPFPRARAAPDGSRSRGCVIR
jgi:ribosomal protein L2